ncbi:MAG TPA: transglycosylase SLT domain-containing protein [bacterium]|nr:transglycosylase SLT domain-containing protein [bacterium]
MNARAAGALALLAGLLAAARAPAANAPAKSATEPFSLPLPELISHLEAIGLVSESQRLLRREIDAGADWAREPLLASLVRSGHAEEALERVEHWGGADKLRFENHWFALARIQETSHDRESAAASFVRSFENEPLLSDYAANRAALVLEAMSRDEEALRLYELSAETSRNPEFVERARWKAAQLALERHDANRALSNLQKVTDASKITRADRLELEASARRVLGDEAGEEQTLLKLIQEAPSSQAAVRAVEKLEKRGHDTLAEHVTFARIGISARAPALTEAHARSALHELEKHPDPALEGEVRLMLGRALVQRGKLLAARDELAKLPAAARPEDRAQAALERARNLWKLDQLDAALAEYDSLAASDAPPAFRSKAAWEAAREAKDARRTQDALVRLARFRAQYPEDDAVDDALWHETRLWIETGQVDSAIVADSLLRALPKPSPFRDESSYTLAKELVRVGRVPEACTRAQTLWQENGDGYWSIRARETIGTERCAAVAAGHAAADSAWSSLESGSLATYSGSEALQRAAVLARWGLQDDAENEIAILRRELSADAPGLRALAATAESLGVPRAGMAAAVQLRARMGGGSILTKMIPESSARLIFPLAHIESVLHWSDEYNVDPFFVMAVMREESWLDPEAVSRAGARGLLQIMPETGQDVARQSGLEDFQRGDLFDPAINIRLGVFYLRRLFDRLDNEPLLVLAAYNAGEKNAQRWRADAQGSFDADRTAAGITYTETFDYVQKVLSTCEIYRSLYAESLPRMREMVANPQTVD